MHANKEAIKNSFSVFVTLHFSREGALVNPITFHNTAKIFPIRIESALTQKYNIKSDSITNLLLPSERQSFKQA